MPAGTVATPEQARQLTAFFFWATWACVTERPGQDISYTNNWPPEALVGNVPMDCDFMAGYRSVPCPGNCRA